MYIYNLAIVGQIVLELFDPAHFAMDDERTN